MKILGKSFKIKVSVFILVIFFLLTVFSIIWFIKTNDEKLLSLLGSLAAGLIVAIIQFVISWQDYIQNEKLKELELIKVMYDRDDRTFYEEYIDKAKRKISVMGVTAMRFFNDFADYEQSSTKNAKVLLHKLAQGTKVKILLPNSEFLKETKKNDFEKVKQHIEKIKNQFSEYKLEVRYFKHIPSHSIFITDDTCIVGPVFPNIESKYTPALHLRNSSPLAIKYLDYFNDEWENAHE
jgi:hypothetical protein